MCASIRLSVCTDQLLVLSDVGTLNMFATMVRPCSNPSSGSLYSKADQLKEKEGDRLG